MCWMLVAAGVGIAMAGATTAMTIKSNNDKAQYTSDLMTLKNDMLTVQNKSNLDALHRQSLYQQSKAIAAGGSSGMMAGTGVDTGTNAALSFAGEEGRKNYQENLKTWLEKSMNNANAEQAAINANTANINALFNFGSKVAFTGLTLGAAGAFAGGAASAGGDAGATTGDLFGTVNPSTGTAMA